MAVQHLRPRIPNQVDTGIPVNTPAKLSTLTGWWAADFQQSKDNLNDGDAVGTFTDYSGKGFNFTQATGANKPTYKANIQNGKGVLRFNGTNNFMQTLSVNWGTILNFFIVLIPRGTASFSRILETNRQTHYYIGYNGAGTGYQELINTTNTTVDDTGNGPLVVGSPSYLVGTYDGTTAFIYHNLVQKNTQAFTVPTTTTIVMNLGQAIGGGGLMNADICEIVILNAAPSTADRTMLDSYFNTKWGLHLK